MMGSIIDVGVEWIWKKEGNVDERAVFECARGRMWWRPRRAESCYRPVG